MGRQPVGMDELVEHWTVLDNETELVAGKRGPTRLGFALLLKYYTRHGRFPHGRAEFPDEVVGYVARQMKVPAADLGFYEWSGRTIEYHRAQIRQHLGFRVCGVADAEKLTAWLATHVAHAERHPDRVREELLKHCRAERIEPPAPDRVTRMVRSALHTAEESWYAVISARLNDPTRARVLGLVEADAVEEQDDDGESVLALIKSMPGNVSLESMLREIRKLTAIRALGLPTGLFADVAPKVLASWRARAAVESPSHLRRRAPEASEEPLNLRRVKTEVARRWDVVPLIDMLKEAVLRTGCLQRVTAVSGGGNLAPEVLAERLMLAIYAYGTNTGIRSVAGGTHGHTEEEIRYVRRRYLTLEAARQIAIEIANAQSG